jgi:hypothetical protein
MTQNLRSLLVAAYLSLSSSVSAQRPTPFNGPAQPAVAADPKDVASANAIITALYDANTIMVDQKRGADRFRSLFAPDARMMATMRGLNTRTVDEYVRSASAGQPRHGFSEREIARTTEAFGNILQAFSTYETLRDSTDKNPIHGINSIQLFNDGSRWWVVTVLWDTERPDNPIPAAYKPRPKSP